MVDPDPNTIQDDPPVDETERAIWAIRRLVKAATGKTLTQEETRELFNKAKVQMEEALAEVTPK